MTAPTTARPDLAAAVSTLCDTERVRVERDPVAVKAAHAEAVTIARSTGTTTRDLDSVLAAYRRLKWVAAGWADRPALLAQLRQAVAHGGETQERAGGGAGTPIRPDALDLLDRIRGTVRDALDLLKLTARRVDDPMLDPIHADLRRLTVADWAGTDGGETARTQLADRLNRYTNHIRGLLDPDPSSAERSARDTPCMSCSALYITERRDGDTERHPALRLDFASGLLRGISCRACGAYVWREVDTDGEPAGAFAELRDHAAAHHSALAAWSADLRDTDRQAREARELGARWGVPYLDQVTGYDTQTITIGAGADAAEVTYVTWTYTDGSDWRVCTHRRPLTPRRTA